MSEASGLVVLPDGRRVVHNDSGDSARYFVLDGCAVTAQVSLVGITARDWEDVGLGPAPGGGPLSLWFADTGNNRLVDRPVSLVVTPVPAPSAAGRLTAPATTYRLSLPRAPADIEALVVDRHGGGPALITKNPLGVAEILVPAGPLVSTGIVPLRPAGTFALSPTGTPGGPVTGLRALAAQVAVTGADLSPDGATLVARTYTDLYDWAVPADKASLGDRLAAATQRTPGRVALVARHQGEGVGVTPDGRDAVLITEGDDPPVDTVALPSTGGPPSHPTTPATGPTTPAGSGGSSAATAPRNSAAPSRSAASMAGTDTTQPRSGGLAVAEGTVLAGVALLAAVVAAGIMHIRARRRGPRR